MALSQAMTAEMTAALLAAEQQARIKYDQLMSSVDDTMSANERRQPYEVYDGGGGNGSADSAEFTGKPIVGTNSFGNVEISAPNGRTKRLPKQRSRRKFPRKKRKKKMLLSNFSITARYTYFCLR
ncbi:MAG: hypothetical protein ACI4XF_01455 [Oscillospiraceae bacterium]